MRALILIPLLMFGFGGYAMAASIHIGILDWRASEEFQRHWLPTLANLQHALPDHSLHLHPLTLQELEEALSQQRIQFLVTNPGHYVHLSSRFELAPLATLESFIHHLPLHEVGSTLLVRDDSAITTLEALRGQHLGAVADDAFGGFQIMADTLQQRGVDPWRHLGALTFTGFPMDQLVTRLQAGEFDAVVVRSCLLEMLVHEQGADTILQGVRVVGEQEGEYPCRHSSERYPGWPFLTTGYTEPYLARQVALALLNSPAIQTLDGYSQWQVPVSYQSVYQLFERLRVGPFAAFPRNPVAAWFHQYWHWPALVLMLVLLLLAHALRSRHLVRQRTCALLQTQTSLRQRDAEVAHLSRLNTMGELTAALAHELNQPLTAIANYARASGNYLSKDDSALLQARPRLQQASALIAAQAEQAGGTLRQLRGFLRREEESPQLLTVRALVQEALELFAGQLEQSGTQVEVGGEGLDQPLLLNRTALLQVLLNLLRNAVEAMQSVPQSDRRIRIQMQVCHLNQQLELSLCDTGEGISEQIAACLFTPFVTTKADGMGLGLVLSRRLLQAQGGDLTLQAAAGGACARITLPLAQIRPLPTEQEQDA